MRGHQPTHHRLAVPDQRLGVARLAPPHTGEALPKVEETSGSAGQVWAIHDPENDGSL